MQIFIVTGLSGAGKSTMAGVLEDMGMFCTDNLPPALLGDLAKLQAAEGEDVDNRLVIVMDARTVQRFGEFTPLLHELKQKIGSLKIIFMEASDDTIMARYNLTRRKHPLAGRRTLSEAINAEREMMAPLKAMADITIDTGPLSAAELRKYVFDIFSEKEKGDNFSVRVMSFGFKYGIPRDCNTVLDARLLPNPWHVPELRPLSGLDQAARDYIFALPAASEFLNRQSEIFKYSLPLYRKEGRLNFTIAIGCTGGRHRSVALAESLSAIIKDSGYNVITYHRDIHRDEMTGYGEEIKKELNQKT